MAPEMRAAVFQGPGEIRLETKPVPEIGPTDALVRMTTTTICGSDIHILKGEYPVQPGLTIGHELVGVIEAVGALVEGYRPGQRVIVGAITPNGQDYASLSGCGAHSGGQHAHGWKPLGGWRFGNTIDGCQAEYVRVPDAVANLEPVPDELTDEQVLMCPDMMSTGFAGAENGGVKLGDLVAVFAQGPVGLCAAVGARLAGAAMVIGVDRLPERLEVARALGVDHVVDASRTDPVQAILDLTDGRGVDVAIEALGLQETFAAALAVLRPGGTLSSLGVYSKDLTIPIGLFVAGAGDHTIRTTLCPGGKERMRRLIAQVQSGRADLRRLVTHRFRLADIEAAYDLFGHQRDGVLKVAITP